MYARRVFLLYRSVAVEFAGCSQLRYRDHRRQQRRQRQRWYWFGGARRTREIIVRVGGLCDLRAGYRQRRITVKKRIDKGRARGKRKRSIYGGICHLYMLLYYVIRRYIGQIALWMHFQDKVHPDERTPLPPSPPFQRYYHDYWLYTSVTGGRDGGGGGNTDVYYTWHWYYFGLKPQRPTFITI